MTTQTRTFILAAMLMVLCAFQASAHTWEIRVNQNQNGTLTWYIQSYHTLSESDCLTQANQSGLIINGVTYPIQSVHSGDISQLSSTVFGVNTNCGTARNIYGVINTPFLGTTLNVTPYSNVACWDNCGINAVGNFTPPPPPVCTSCPLTGWTNTVAPTGNNNGTACTPQDDKTTATITVSHLACANITGDKQFSLIFDAGGANVPYGPFNYAAGVETSVTISVPYGTTASTPVKVIDTDFPCEITHGLTLPGNGYQGEKETVPPVMICTPSVSVNSTPGRCGAIVTYTNPTATDNCTGGAFNFFNAGEPNNSGGEDYLQLYNSGTWNDLPERNNNRSIVEFNSITNTQIANYSKIGDFGGHSYYISSLYQSWNAARSSALGIGGDLASINTLGETDFLKDYGGSTWVGGYQDHSDPAYAEPGNASQNFGGWKWVDGTKLGAGQIVIKQMAGLPSGSEFPVGTTTNTFTATDEAGNTSTCSFTVTVSDNQIPVITSNGNKTVNADPGMCGAAVAVSATATDNCSVGAPVGVRSDGQPLNVVYPVGTTTITWNVRDVNTNAAATVTQTVTVNDVTAPAVPVLADVTGECSASATVPTAMDNCAGTVTGTTSDPLSYSTQGTHVIHWKFDDGHGNVSTATQNVIIKDVTPPVIACQFNITVNADANTCGAVVNYDAPSATDNCGTGALPTSIPGYTNKGTLGGHAYFLSNTVTTPEDAHAKAIALGGHLVTINSAAENAYVSAMSPNYIWIGYTDRAVEGSFKWVTNEPVTYVNWNSGEPNNAGDEDWAVINWGPNGTWNDWTYSSPALYVVEFEGGNIPTTKVSGLGSGATFPVGVTTETWQAVDAGGNRVTCSFTVTVLDKQAPVAPVLADVTGECSASVTAPVAVDACKGNITGTTTSPLNYTAQGTYTINWSFNDGNGNISTTTQKVIVKDNTAPVPTISELPTINGECSATASAPTATDNCKGVITATTSDPVSYTTQGTHIITWTYNDGNGNISSQQQTVIVKDVTPPTIICVAPIAVSNDKDKCGAVVNYTAPTATDNCVGASGTQTFSYAGAAQTFTVPEGVTSLTVDATGAAGGASYNGGIAGKGGRVQAILAVTPGQTLTIYVGGVGATGTTAPPASGGFNGGGSGNGISGCCGAGGGGGATDIRIGGIALTNRVLVAAGGGAAGSDGGSTSGGGAGGLVGGTPGNGNNPSTIEATGGTQTNGGSGGSLGGYPSAFPGTLGQGGNGASGGIGGGGGGGYYGGGGGTWAGGAGGSSYANGNVTSSVAHTSDFQSGNGQLKLTWGSSSTVITQTSGLPSGSQFPIGVTTNTFEATDIAGNRSTCSFTVTVVDAQAPVLVGVPSNTTVECNAVPVAANVTATDNCTTSAVSYTETRVDGTCSSAYTLTRTWSTTDAAGNTTTASQVITVQDTKAPELVVPSDITVNNDATKCGAVVSFTATATDNCNTPTIIYSHASGTVFPVGSTTVTVTATDACNNTTTKTFSVTVTDNEKPVVHTNSFTIQLDAAGQASITKEQVNNGSTDNCGIASISIDKSSFDCSNVGANTVTLTVTDVHGNTQTGTAVITVEDKVAPVVVTKNISITLHNGAASISAADIDGGSSDACGIQSMTVSKAGFDCDNLGSNTATLTVTDKNGNVSTGTAVVTVIGVKPVPSITLSRTDNTFTGLPAATIALGYGAQSVSLNATNATSAQAATTYAWSPAAGLSSTTVASPVFTPTAAGSYTFSVTATNEFGCTATTQVTITVVDVRCGNKNDKVLVCQATGSAKNPWVQICIAPSAVATHLANGSTLGTCTLNAVTTRDGTAKPKVELVPVVSVYPNPSRGQASLRLKDFAPGKVQIEVLDATGKVVVRLQESVSYKTEDITLQLSHLAQGLYTIKATGQTEHLSTKLVIAR